MGDSIRGKAMKVQQYLHDKGFEFKVRELPDSTRTARDAAKAVGCDMAQIAKSLVFMDMDEKEPVLVIASGANRVSLDKIKASTGMALDRANGKEIKKMLGFAIGGIPPAGHDKKLHTLLDRELKVFEKIWAAAGTPNAVFELAPEDLEALTQGKWMDLAQ